MTQTPFNTDSGSRSVASPPRRYNRNLILVVLLFAVTMSLFQASSVNVALSPIAEATGASSAQLQWILSGYALAIGIALVPMGRVGDLIGHSELFVLGVVAFTIASFACGMVSDPAWLTVLRVLQGFAGGTYSPQITGIIQQFFQGQARATAYALVGFITSAAVAVAPVLAGQLIDWLGPEAGWRSAFLINLPLGIAATVAACFWLPFGVQRRRRKAEEGSARRADLDPVGALLLVVTVVMILLPFVTDGSAWVWALLPAALIAGATWVYWERSYAARGKDPMVDLRLFTLSSFSYCNAAAVLQFLGISSVFAISAIYLQQGLGESALIAGLIGLPNALVAAVSSLWAGKYAISHGRGLQVFAVAMMTLGVLTAGGFALLVPHGWSIWWMAFGLTLQGVGQGSMAAVNRTQALLDVPPAQGGVAGGVIKTLQRVSTAIGNTIMTGIFFALAAGATATGGEDAVATWSRAIGVSYGAIGAVTACCLVVALLYWRAGRRAPRS